MSKAQHTPGPWTFDWHFIVADDPRGEHEDIYIAELCESDETGRFEPDEKVRDANRRLIAAAPELLEALRELAEAADADIYTDAPECAALCERVGDAIVTARGIIAKAVQS